MTRTDLRRRTRAWVGAVGLLLTTAVTGQSALATTDDVAGQTAGSAQVVSGTEAPEGEAPAPEDETADLPGPDGVIGAIRGRLAGNDRFGSAVAISKFEFTNPVRSGRSTSRGVTRSPTR